MSIPKIKSFILFLYVKRANVAEFEPATFGSVDRRSAIELHVLSC
jgi:hypothetical protein